MSQIKRDNVTFTLDGVEVVAFPYETIWQVATRHGKVIPHLCHRESAGYRPDGNCRSCLVEIEGMKVHTGNPRAERARSLVMELLLADQPARTEAHDPGSQLWQWADRLGLASSRSPVPQAIAP